MVSITKMKKTTLRQAAMKLALVACVLLAPLGLSAQTIITIGEGTSTQRYPLPGYYGYQYDVFIYTPTIIAALIRPHFQIKTSPNFCI